jgi:leader peptidase (prepilin peptidase)/N-methyltransferase
MDVRLVEVILATLFGLLIGSFLNVCIYRWPRDLSVVQPRSFCPSCLDALLQRHGYTPDEDDAPPVPPAQLHAWMREAQVAWYDNIPVASYALLRGKCRNCGAAINWRYPLVEFLTAVAFAWFVWQFGLTPAALKYCVLAALLIGLIFSDLETLLLPDELTIGGFFIGLAFSLVVPVPGGIFASIFALFGVDLGARPGSFVEALLGGLVPSGAIWFGGWLFEKLRAKEGLGFGDVKMLAMVGAFLGVQGALLTVILGSVAGSVIGLIYIKATGKDAASYPLPFGTFLGAAALVSAVSGNTLLGWYVRTLPR